MFNCNAASLSLMFAHAYKRKNKTMKTVSIKFGAYDLNEEETHVFYEGENCEVFTDQEGKLYITPSTNYNDPLYLDEESQPKDEDEGTFTPGPWYANGPKTQKEFGDQTYFSIQTKHPIIRNKSYVMPGFYYPHSIQTKKEMQANAELIAKAPELYEENLKLKEMLKEISNALKPLAELDLTGVRGEIVYQRDHTKITVSDVNKAKTIIQQIKIITK